MKRTLAVAFAFLVLAVVGLQRAGAVSFSPVPGESEEMEARGIRLKGESVCLFQSGTVDVRKQIGVGDVLVVFRQEKSGSVREVGKVRVLSFVGADYLRAEVVDGELEAGDVAKRGEAASLVISSEERCR